MATVHANPAGDPTSLTSASSATPATVTATAAMLRRERLPTTASAIDPTNSTAATVPSGRASMAK